MYLKVILFFSTVIYFSNGAVLLWSNNKLEVSPLTDFTDATLNELEEKLGYPELSIYKTSSSLLPEFKGFLEGYYTAYNPNGEINTENATEISGRDDLSLLQAKSREYNTLSVLYLSNQRHKRELSDSSTPEVPQGPPQGPVLYRAKSNKDIFSLLYSSQPLLLRNFVANFTTEIGESPRVTVDTKNQITRLYIKVPEENNIQFIILQFFFEKVNGYWSLNSARVGSSVNASTVNLTITEPFSVPTRFSYHCNGETVFTDPGNTVELVLYDFQAQMESKREIFSDAYDCVDFTTVPIWSGLLVTGLLGIGLVIALIAIGEIKTMDKFDNQKTKQLAITVAE